MSASNKTSEQSQKRNLTIVTGGLGFIGMNYLHEFPAGSHVLVIDAGHPESNKPSVAAEITSSKGYTCFFEVIDMCETQETHKIIDAYAAEFNIESIIHFAASSHVDDSIKSPAAFVQNNINSTLTILEWIRMQAVRPRFIYISTDEVYGHITSGADRKFKETDARQPRSPYSASKAASEMLVESYHHTFGIDYVITRCCNNYGKYQHESKLLPKVVKLWKEGKPAPLYGAGANIREWIPVEIHNNIVKELDTLWREGKLPLNTAYNIGSGLELSNRELLDLLKRDYAAKGGEVPNPHFVSVGDRLGHDYRYAVDTSKLERVIDAEIMANYEMCSTKAVLCDTIYQLFKA